MLLYSEICLFQRLLKLLMGFAIFYQIVDFQGQSFGILDRQPLVSSGLAFLDLIMADLVASVVRRRLPREQAAPLRNIADLFICRNWFESNSYFLEHILKRQFIRC